MTETETRALAIIVERGSVTCANLGGELWKDSHRGKGSGSSCPFARPAGRIVKSLIEQGLVERDFSDKHHTLYRATALGKTNAHG